MSSEDLIGRNAAIGDQEGFQSDGLQRRVQLAEDLDVSSHAQIRMRILVDADACPVKDEIVRVAERYGIAAIFVSNAWMRLPISTLVERRIVAEGPDAADDWIAGEIGAMDICVTQDIPLAGRCLKKGARALSPAGRKFTPDNIGMAQAVRDLKAHLRETGEISGGAPAFARADRSRVLEALEQAVQDIRRQR